MSEIKIAGVQMDIKLADRQTNLHAMRERLAEATQQGARLTVFPECSISGYCFETLQEASEVAEPAEGDSFQAVLKMCQEFRTMVVYGFLESAGEQVYNSLLLVGPTGVLGRYRKIHLPFLGVDRFTTSGTEPNAVFATPDMKVGMNICYDISFPEASRCLTLGGADLIVLPTNWPKSSGLVADVIPNCRALENHVYFMSVNRVGVERDIPFIGKSKIIDPSGKNLAFADHADEVILYAEIDPARARQKHLVNIPGVHEVHRINDRHPEHYGAISRLR